MCARARGGSNHQGRAARAPVEGTPAGSTRPGVRWRRKRARGVRVRLRSPPCSMYSSREVHRLCSRLKKILNITNKLYIVLFLTHQAINEFRFITCERY